MAKSVASRTVMGIVAEVCFRRQSNECGDGMMHADNPTSPGTWWQRQEFEPGILGWAVNPYYFARRGLLAGLREFFPELRGEVLDVGCGRKPYRAFIPDVRYARKSSERPR